MSTPVPDKTKLPWYAPGMSFECTQCGNCCTGPTGFVWFTPEEAEKIAAHLEMSVDEFHKRYSRKLLGRRTLTEIKIARGQYDCVFLTRDAETGKTGCSIYPVRPTQCRTWPFWESNLESPEAWEHAARNCPGMRRSGNFVPIEEIRIRLGQNPEGL